MAARTRWAVISSAISLLMAAPGAAQIDTANLVIRSVDSAGAALPEVAVIVRSDETGLERTATTDRDGRVTITALPPGPWSLSAARESYQTITDQPLQLLVGQTMHLRLVFQTVASGSVTVSGELPMIDLYRADVSTNIVPKQIGNLPIPDRQFDRLALLAPTVQPDPTLYFGRTGTPVLGPAGSAWSNTYLLDGIDVTNPGNGQPLLDISPDAIREFRVISQGFDAEIGLSTGGALSVVTHSGGNQLIGLAYAFYRGDALRARGALEQESGDFTRYHVGFTLGGAIVPDRSHFFVAFEHVNDDDVALYRPGGEFAGQDEDVPYVTSSTLALLSLDHAFTASSSGFATLFYNHGTVENDQVGGVADESWGWSVKGDTVMLVAGHTWLMDADRLNELRALVHVQDSYAPLNSSAVGEWFSRGATRQTGAHLAGTADVDDTNFRLQDTLHWQVPHGHELRSGLIYQHSRWRVTADRFQHGFLVYDNDTRNVPISYSYGIGSSTQDLETDAVGVFIQDDWRVNATLTVGLGLRYDLELGGNNPDFEHPLVGHRGHDTDNVQPRLSLVWDLGGAGRTILRGGAGRYTGRYLVFPAIWELQFNGVSGRQLFTRVSVPGNPIDITDPEHTGLLLPPDISLLADDLEAPESTQANLGLSQRLGSSGLVLGVDAMWAEGRNELVYRDTNWKGNDDPCMRDPVPTFSCRIDPGYTAIDRYTNEGRSRYRALSVGLSGTLEGGHLLSASLTFGDKKNIMDDALTNVKPSDSADVEGEWGRSSTDERVRLVVSGVFYLPWGLTLAPVYEYGSGRPWNVLVGDDDNGDLSYFDRQPGHRRNDQDGPRFSQLSLRLTKAVPLGRGNRFDLIVEVFNVFNTTNYDATSVDNAYLDGTNPRFGEYTATLPPREIQLGLRYVF
jgi:hypothetical protein